MRLATYYLKPFRRGRFLGFYSLSILLCRSVFFKCSGRMFTYCLGSIIRLNLVKEYVKIYSSQKGHGIKTITCDGINIEKS